MHLCFFQLLGDWEAQMRRVMKMIAGGGLSITGSHTMCGDYLYSGHTVMLTLTYLFIKECKSRRSSEKCHLMKCVTESSETNTSLKCVMKWSHTGN